jgi:hypothetical protein
MSDSRPATDGTGAPEDIQRLQDRIKELEHQLESREAAVGRGAKGHSGNQGLKILTVVLAALSLSMALPAFVTLRRWYDWWR